MIDRRQIVWWAIPALLASMTAWLYASRAGTHPGPKSQAAPAPSFPATAADSDGLDDPNAVMQRYHAAFVSASSAAALSSALRDLADLSQSYDVAEAMAEAGLYGFLVGHLSLCLNSTTAAGTGQGRCLTPLPAQLALTLGSAAHNHPPVSRRLTDDDGAVPVLAALVRDGTRDAVHRSLQALSSIIGSYPGAGSVFVGADVDGLSVLMAAAVTHPVRVLRVLAQLALGRCGVQLPCHWAQDVVTAAVRAVDDDDDDLRSDADLLAASITMSIKSQCGQDQVQQQQQQEDVTLMLSS